MQNSIFEIVRDAEDNYLHGTVHIGEYVEFDMHNVLETTEAYVNSKHTSGPTDALGRDKPFFNIVTAAMNVWYRATDLDRKNINFVPTNAKSVPLAFIANVLLQNWMNDNRFGQFLNSWGRTLAKNGSAVVKFVEKDGELIPSVIPWSRLIVDPIDFDAIPRIEKFYKTPAQLRKMGYDSKVVENLIAAVSTRKTLDGNQKDNQSGFIELYEVHGELPDYMLLDDYKDDGNEENVKYTQQMHVVSFVKDNASDKYTDYCLYKGKEKKDPYMITHLIEEDGRTLSIGAVESLFDAQWMQNHTMKNMKDLLDLTSKMVYQTADGGFVGKNVIKNIENGDILITDDNKPLSQVNTSKQDITALQNFSSQWSALAQEITSTPDAVRGNTLPSGTPFALAEYAGSQASSLFEIMTENKGLSLEDMIRIYIIPNLKKRLKNTDEIVAILDAAGIDEIDAMYIPKKAVSQYNQTAKNMMIKGVVPSPYQADIAEMGVKADIAEMGNKRFFKPSEFSDKQWDEIFSDFAWDSIRVEVTNENSDKLTVLTTLNTTFQTIARNPAVLQDKNAMAIFSAILSETGRFSPLQITSASTPTPPAMPTAAPPGGTEALPIT